MEDYPFVNNPSPAPPQPDPTLVAEQQQAQDQLIQQLQGQAQADTASLMARYGTRLAVSGAAMNGSPLIAASVGR